MRIALWIVCLLVSLLGLSQELHLYGTVKNSEERYSPMIGVHVRNHTKQLLAITGPNGSFKLPVEMGDSVSLTHIGFSTIKLVITEEHVNVLQDFTMKTEAEELPEVVVNIFPEYWRFKKLVLETDPVDSVITFDLPIVYDPRAEPLIDPIHPPMAMGFRFDIEGLTKRGKEKRKLKKLLARKKLLDEAYAKFDRDWVAKTTKLEGDELTSFIAFCDFEPEYLIATPIMKIKEDIMDLLEEFNANRSQEVDDRYSPGASLTSPILNELNVHYRTCKLSKKPSNQRMT